MRQAKSMRANAKETAAPKVPQLRAVPSPPPRLPSLATARVHEVTGAEVLLEIGGELVPATLDAPVHPSVIDGARSRGERVLVEQDASGALVVLGALRTQPTPGIDAAEEYAIEAKRISLKAGEEIALTTQAAAVVVRALGEVETYADRILSRAEGVHKIVGRMLRLN